MNTFKNIFRAQALLVALVFSFFVTGCGSDNGTGSGSGSGVGSGALYAADGGGGNAATRLYTLNPATGAIVTNIGPIGFAVTGLAIQPGTGKLYGSTGGNAPVSPNSIITINKKGGAGTLLGATGLTSPVADLTFTSDGKLYGWSEATDDLVTINLTTGVATVVADSTLSTSGSGLAASSTNVLFFTGNGALGALRTVNKTTGLTTVVATMTGPAGGSAINALAFNGSTLYGSRSASAGVGSATTLITINTTTGAITSLGASVNDLDAIVFDKF